MMMKYSVIEIKTAEKKYYIAKGSLSKKKISVFPGAIKINMNELRFIQKYK
jgi:hypothetical protein